MDVMMKNFVDVSSFFSFEATGDSEADFDDPNMVIVDYDHHDNDDAESCICDLSDFRSGGDVGINGCDVRSCVDDDDEGEEEEEEEQGEEACSYGSWSSGHNHNNDNDNNSNNNINGVFRDRNSNLNACVDANKEERMSEMEKSRLFWETCLAS